MWFVVLSWCFIIYRGLPWTLWWCCWIPRKPLTFSLRLNLVDIFLCPVLKLFMSDINRGKGLIRPLPLCCFSFYLVFVVYLHSSSHFLLLTVKCYFYRANRFIKQQHTRTWSPILVFELHEYYVTKFSIPCRVRTAFKYA